MASQPEPEPEPSACPDQVEKIIGLVEPKAPSDGTIRGIAGAAATAAVVERRSIEGRVVSVLDPRRLVARARSAIEDMAA